MQNKSDKKELKYNTIALMIIQILNYVLPFITLPYISRIFEVEKLGIIFFALVIMDYFWRFIMFGFDFSAVRQLAIHSNSQKQVNLIFNSVLISQIMFLILGFIILGGIIYFIPKFRGDWLIYIFTYVLICGRILTLTWFYQGMAKMKFTTIVNVTAKAISLILIFACIRKADDYILYPIINAAGMVVAAIVSLWFAKNNFKIKFYIPKFKTIWKTLKYSSSFFMTKVAIALYRQTNAFIIGIVCTSVAVAYYVAADTIFWGVIALYGTFINALFPYMSKNKDLKFFKKMLKYLIILAVGASIVLLISSKLLILLFYSEKYMDSIKILQIFSLSFACYVFVDTLGFPLLGAFGYVKETNSGYIIGGIYNIIGLGILYLSNHINIYSVAILVSSTYLVMFLHRLYYIHKYKLLSAKEVA